MHSGSHSIQSSPFSIAYSMAINALESGEAWSNAMRHWVSRGPLHGCKLGKLYWNLHIGKHPTGPSRYAATKRSLSFSFCSNLSIKWTAIIVPYEWDAMTIGLSFVWAKNSLNAFFTSLYAIAHAFSLESWRSGYRGNSFKPCPWANMHDCLYRGENILQWWFNADPCTAESNSHHSSHSGSGMGAFQNSIDSHG